MGVVSIQIVMNGAAAGLYLLLRLLLQVGPEQTRRPIIRARKLKILLSLLAIPTWTALYVRDVMTLSWALPVSFYITALALLVCDVLREYNGLVKAERRTSEEDTIESSQD